MTKAIKFLTADAYDIRILKNVECYDHLHFHMEIAIVTKGQLHAIRETESLVIDEVMAVLIMPYELHNYKSCGETETIIIEFNPMLFDELKDRGSLKSSVFKLTDSTLKYVKDKLFSANHSEIFIKSLIYPIINDLFTSKDAEVAFPVCSEICSAALKYIDENYTENINLKTAAKSVGCSYVYLSRIFSDNTGISFTSYLNRYRIMKSLKALTKTDMTISEIAYSCGFDTLRSYNREFKKCLNTTPKNYRAYGYSYYAEVKYRLT